MAEGWKKNRILCWETASFLCSGECKVSWKSKNIMEFRCVKRQTPEVMYVLAQVNREWKVNAEGLKPLRNQAVALRQRFSHFELNHVYR
jgi:hypothetical protein